MSSCDVVCDKMHHIMPCADDITSHNVSCKHILLCAHRVMHAHTPMECTSAGCIPPSTGPSFARMARSAADLSASLHIQFLSCGPQHTPGTVQRYLGSTLIQVNVMLIGRPHHLSRASSDCYLMTALHSPLQSMHALSGSLQGTQCSSDCSGLRMVVDFACVSCCACHVHMSDLNLCGI